MFILLTQNISAYWIFSTGYQKIEAANFSWKIKIEVLCQHSLKNDDVKNSIWLHVDEWRLNIAKSVKDKGCFLKSVEDWKYEEPGEKN
mgnify:CR=1 FL=1